MNGLEKAIKKAGNASNLAALLGIKPMSAPFQAVSRKVAGIKQ